MRRRHNLVPLDGGERPRVLMDLGVEIRIDPIHLGFQQNVLVRPHLVPFLPFQHWRLGQEDGRIVVLIHRGHVG